MNLKKKSSSSADWEYPVANDCGGKPEDFTNLVLLASDIRDAFDSVDPAWEHTMTLPASYCKFQALWDRYSYFMLDPSGEKCYSSLFSVT